MPGGLRDGPLLGSGPFGALGSARPEEGDFRATCQHSTESHKGRGVNQARGPSLQGPRALQSRTTAENKGSK